MKPPKSWLAEYAANKSKYSNNNTKNNDIHLDGSKSNTRISNGSFGSNMDNSFRHYMARKIELQREQFGLQLPPTPDHLKGRNENENKKEKYIFREKERNDGYKSYNNYHGDGTSHDMNWKDESIQVETMKSSHDFIIHKKCVRFEHDINYSKKVLIDNESVPLNVDEYEETETGMGAVLNRLKHKYGNKRRRKSRNMLHEKKKEKDNKHYVDEDKSQKHHSQISMSLESMKGNNMDTLVLEQSRETSAVSSLHAPISSPVKHDNMNITGHNEIHWPLDTDNMPSELDNSTIITSTSPCCNLKRKRPDLFFLGVTVLVNGYTNPGLDSLMRALHKYGGNLEKYETNHVTHIIAETLSTAKANIYKRQKKPIPVVKPKWIVDCVEACKLLPYQDYLLDEVKDNNSGPSVKTFFNTSSKQGNEGSTFDNTNNKMNTSGGNKAVVPSPMPSPSKKHQVHSGPRTVGNDPNFLDSYFASSRLSFIGSFKQRLKQSTTNNNKLGRQKLAQNDDASRFVYHIDMDCFFAAIAIRNYPQYKNKPVAVGHGWRNDPNGINHDNLSSNVVSTTISSKNSTSELSTCNYAARKYGVKKGMFAHQARKLCPDLVILPYDYEGYEEASLKVTEILNQFAQEYCGVVEQVSCDESYLEIFVDKDEYDTDEIFSNVMKDIGKRIKSQIFDAIECTVSIGISSNKLLAKLATDKVKDKGGNGVHFITNEKEFLSQVKLRELPGVGYKVDKKLQAHNLYYVSDVWEMEDENEICSILGKGNGSKIYNYCHGIDSRPVKPSERKTIGAECNYGVRFGDGPYGVDYMMAGLAKEVVKRMENVGVMGKHITIKVKERKENAPSPGKFNGCGWCNDHSKSVNLPVYRAVRDIDLFCKEGMKLFAQIGVDQREVRGMGMIISKLEYEHGKNQHAIEKENINFWMQKSEKHLSEAHESNEKVVVELASPENNTHHKAVHEVTEIAQAYSLQHECRSVSNMNTNPNKQSDLGSSRKKHASIGPDRIVLPPLQDISMEDVNSLPSDLRDNVLALIKEKQETNTRTSKQKLIQKPRDSGRSVKHKGFKRDGQIDMKRMMKLASVKAGEEKVSIDGEQISLTQLDHLPLDLQLQVANNDNLIIQKVSVSKSDKDKVSSRVRRSIFDHPNECLEVDVDRVNGNVHNQVKSSSDLDELDDLNDLKVLRSWLDEKLKPNHADVIKLTEFLCRCISEMRVDDTVIFLRLAKRKWSSLASKEYETILNNCNNHLMECQGRHFDRDGLGL